ncbi:MAG: aminopeptidase P family protein [Planctomycetota bacterium]
MTREKVEALRRLMQEHDVRAYIISGKDPHQSEYAPDLWQRRRFISGFTGSAGDVVITRSTAGFWTDFRYYLQAEDQLDSDVFTLFKTGLPDVPTFESWLAQVLGKGDKVGLDTRLFSCDDYENLREKLEGAGKILCPIDENLVDAIWEDQPALPKDPVRVHDMVFAGESVADKLFRIRALMQVAKAEAHVVTMLDAIAWLFNLRGSDVVFNPVFVAYAVVTVEDVTLYVNPEKMTEKVRTHLGKEVRLAPYDEFENGLQALRKTSARIWIDPSTCSQWVVDQLRPDVQILFRESPVKRFKAIKNETERKGSRSAHIRDGAALVKMLVWLEEAVPAGGVTERVISSKLEEFRAQGEHFRGPSFESIVGYGEHGAIIHYAATPETDMAIEPRGILLIDSGGQYLDGTTDVTRTLALSTPTEEQRDRFTRVLKGHIRLTMQPFPQGTDGVQLDTLARMFLWETGCNFGHGIGHGVGSYLNVHESPPSISYIAGRGIKPEPGMICSNEPGYYKAGEYGLRQENLVEVCEVPGLGKDGVPFYKLEPLTLCPIDLKLVDRSLLTQEEIDWLNDYHARVRNSLLPLLPVKEAAWLEKATQPL